MNLNKIETHYVFPTSQRR